MSSVPVLCDIAMYELVPFLYCTECQSCCCICLRNIERSLKCKNIIIINIFIISSLTTNISGMFNPEQNTVMV